jgi:hypothetical protein
MGFKPSSYNYMHTYLVTEEIIQGEKHDHSNLFLWDTLRLNLPGSEEYNPSIAWASKHHKDGLLASDFMCFVNDQHITG